MYINTFINTFMYSQILALYVYGMKQLTTISCHFSISQVKSILAHRFLWISWRIWKMIVQYSESNLQYVSGRYTYAQHYRLWWECKYIKLYQRSNTSASALQINVTVPSYHGELNFEARPNHGSPGTQATVYELIKYIMSNM